MLEEEEVLRFMFEPLFSSSLESEKRKTEKEEEEEVEESSSKLSWRAIKRLLLPNAQPST